VHVLFWAEKGQFSEICCSRKTFANWYVKQATSYEQEKKKKPSILHHYFTEMLSKILEIQNGKQKLFELIFSEVIQIFKIQNEQMRWFISIGSCWFSYGHLYPSQVKLGKSLEILYRNLSKNAWCPGCVCHLILLPH